MKKKEQGVGLQSLGSTDLMVRSHLPDGWQLRVAPTGIEAGIAVLVWDPGFYPALFLWERDKLRLPNHPVWVMWGVPLLYEETPFDEFTGIGLVQLPSLPEAFIYLRLTTRRSEV